MNAVKNYEIQEIIDDYFLIGEVDFHFFFEFFAHFISPTETNFGIFKRFEKLPPIKSESECFENALALSKFFIDSGAYAGFYMPNHRIPYCIYKTYDEYEILIREKNNLFPECCLAQADENGYSVGVVKIKDGAKAPKISLELALLFNSVAK